MLDIGKQARMDRLLHPKTRRTVIIPLDHGIVGTTGGIEDPAATVRKIVDGGADAVLFNAGLAPALRLAYGARVGTIFNLTNYAFDRSTQTLLASVETALRLGADAVSVQVILGADNEIQMLQNTQQAFDGCTRWGIPLLVMMYGNEKWRKDRTPADCARVAARTGVELGADIVKIAYPGSAEALRPAVEACPVPLVIAGGARAESFRDVLQAVAGAVAVGAAGVAIGRNVWQADDPALATRELARIVHSDVSLQLTGA
jgi:fructose-bisphosphate aldolase/2-amino-3,7-dideoxy-D-threo-hept-6-ulosonate synthase